MIAHHPITGQPIHILRTETQLSVDQKTLVWLRASFQESTLWNRWHTVISELGALSVCDTTKLSAIILTADSDIDAWCAALQSQSNDQLLLLAPASVVTSLERKKCQFPMERTLIWEDLYENYPFLGEPLVGTDSVEKVVLALSHILRMNRIVWSSDASRDAMPFGVKACYDAWVRTCAGSIQTIPADSDDSCIPRLWLIQQYFKHSSHKRVREITTCLEKNIACPYVDHILLLNEKEYTDIPVSSKIQTVIMNHRLTYKDAFQAIVDYVPKGDFVAFANADIYFNDTLEYLWKLKLGESRMFLALLRWEGDSDTPRIFGPRADSQDTWILARDAVDFVATDEEFGFAFGKGGCDNALALIMMRRKFLVANPAYSIKTIHLHSSNIRTYDPKDIIYRPHYLYLDPTAIHSCRIEKNLGAYISNDVKRAWSAQYLGESFSRPILGVTEGSVATVCSMIRDWPFRPNEANMYAPTSAAIPLYNFKGGNFVTSEGLVNSFTSIYIGPHPLWKTRWEAARLSSLTSSIHVPHMVAVPFDAELGQSLSTWVLHYLPRVLAVRETVLRAGLPAPEFLVPQIPDIGALLNDLQWKDAKGNITVIPMMNDVNYYSEDVWALPPTDDSHLVTAEDVKRLRSLLPPVKSEHKPVIVFCVQDDPNAVCTREWADSVATHIVSQGWTVFYVAVTDHPTERRKAFANASWIVGAGSALDWIWCAPTSATVMEFMYDSEPIGDHIHLAGAAKIRYIVGLIKKEPIEYQRQNAMLDVGRAIKQYGFRELLTTSRNKIVDVPRIIVPCDMTGIWTHSGDTFREMVDMWGERGYVMVERSNTTNYCWWGGIGEILLYDRPTPRWWNDNISYQMALFGNCAPPGPGPHLLRQSIWGFWPRSPRAIEAMVSRYENLKGYDARSIRSLFLGKVENGIQREHRTGADWSSAVELFSMPFDSTGAAYPYTQEQYLDKLCSSQFGLCLPGFGRKCNREIEYFACGCVPIVTPGVDMKGYLVPPQEGIHYFVAKNPDEVRTIVKNTSAEKWALMSAAGRTWWRTYASVEGLFRLTWARIEQCRPYFSVGIPPNFLHA
jgi:hypothetical protein